MLKVASETVKEKCGLLATI